MSQADFEAALKEPAVQETLEKWKASYEVAKSRAFRRMSSMVNT